MTERRPKGVYVIIEKDSLEKPVFRRVGTAFVNRDDSMNVYLDAVPLSGKLHIRTKTVDNILLVPPRAQLGRAACGRLWG